MGSVVMSKPNEGAKPVPERWSARAKSEVVLRLFRGEAVEAVSRDIQVPVHELETWRRDFLDAGMVGLRKRGGDVEERALKQTQAKVGELAMKLELAELLLEKRGFADELARLKKSHGW